MTTISRVFNHLALACGLMLVFGGVTQAKNDNLYLHGNLLSKSCTPVSNGGLLVEVHFPTMSYKDLMVSG